MRHPSFRLRLFLSFVLVSIIPTVLCAVLLDRTYRTRVEAAQEAQLAEELAAVADALTRMEAGLKSAARTLSDSPEVLEALRRPGQDDTAVNNILFSAAGSCPVRIRFDLYDRKGRFAYSTLPAPEAEILPLDWGILKACADREGLVFCASADPSDTVRPLFLAGCALGSAGSPDGYLVASFYHGNFRALTRGRFSARNSLILTDAHFRPVYAEQPGLSAEIVPGLREALLAGREASENSPEFLFQASAAPSLGLYAILRTPRTLTAGSLSLFRAVSLFAVLFSIFAAVLVGLSLSAQLFTPIERLRRGMSEVSLDHLDVYVEPEGNDELAELTRHFNAMTGALRQNRTAIIEGQKELNEAQIRMLQAQLNPHFLSNTLDTIKWIGKINQVPQVAVMSTDLAQILRFGISPEEFVPLGEELRILDRYMEIQQIRLSGRICCRVEVPEELLGCLVPKMILQPLVENCILHGLPDTEEGQILVRGQARDGALIIRVSDNGPGFPPELLGPYRRTRNDTGHHLGLYNVNTILKKHYGEEWGLLLENDADSGGAVITAAMPLVYRNEKRRENAQDSGGGR